MILRLTGSFAICIVCLSLLISILMSTLLNVDYYQLLKTDYSNFYQNSVSCHKSKTSKKCPKKILSLTFNDGILIILIPVLSSQSETVCKKHILNFYQRNIIWKITFYMFKGNTCRNIHKVKRTGVNRCRCFY